MTDNHDILEEALASPKSVTVDGQTVTERSAEELIRLDRAVSRKGRPLKLNLLKLKSGSARQ